MTAPSAWRGLPIQRPITVTLTYPPSANKLWRNIAGKTLKSGEYRAWIHLNDGLYLQQSAGRGWRQITGPYRLTIIATAPDKRRRDLANLEKATSDFLQHAGVRFAIDVNGVPICHYVADAVYQRKGEQVVEDVKGVSTDTYKLKKKLMLAVHQIQIVEV